MDHADRILAQWGRERPDLDVTPMGLVGRITRLSQHFTREMEKNFGTFGLNLATFDVLATLRRSGPPFSLSPGDLIEMTMVTSGTMTNRIDQLTKAGLVVRTKNPDDGRSVFIKLTNAGFTVVDACVTAHVEVQAKLVAEFPAESRQNLNDLLRSFLSGIEK